MTSWVATGAGFSSGYSAVWMDDLTRHTALDGDLRRPDQVMRLDRMGASFPTRLSFLRTLMRQLHHEKVQVERPVWDMDGRGFGRAVYSLELFGHRYSLVCFSHDLPAKERTDRVIAERWDATFVLFDGMPSADDLARLEAQVPLQEAGRVSERELVMSRANKSLRLFDHVTQSLAAGCLPDIARIGETGYLMRTTAVYGNGKFGLADRSDLLDRPELAGPFTIEMLTVWMIREFSLDLVEHIAHSRNPDKAIPLPSDLRRSLGIGNATGLGMAPFLVTHPELIHKWVAARETALARVRAVAHPSEAEIHAFMRVFDKACIHADMWQVDDPVQSQRITTLRKELAQIKVKMTKDWFDASNPWDRLFVLAKPLGLEAQECVNSAMLEPYGHLIDALTQDMSFGPRLRLDPSMELGPLKAALRNTYDWALRIDFDAPEMLHQFWYVSEDKAEPRLGLRATEPGVALEMPLDIARQAQDLMAALEDHPDDHSVASFVAAHPALRHIVERVQSILQHPFGEIRANLIGKECLPIDLLRFKLAFFGASRFDPKSDRWTRVTLCQGAPLASEIAVCDPDDWAFFSPPSGFAP